MKARASVRMAERASDQVARVTLEKSRHRQYKSKEDVDRSEKEKPTGVTRNCGWSYKIHDNKNPLELVW